MDGIFRLRAMIAVCEVAPPTSVVKAAMRCCLNSIMSAGDRSCATRIRLCSLPVGSGMLLGWPSSALSTRSTTCTTSRSRSRR